MKHGFLLGNQAYDIALSRAAHGYRLHRGDQTTTFDIKPGETGGWLLHSGQQIDALQIAVDGDNVHIHLDGETYQLRFEHALQRLSQLSDGASADAIKASMPGSLISLDVAAGDSVKKGQTLLVMESMKMETSIVAPRDGAIAEVHISAGQTFDKDAVLLTLQAETDAK